MFDPQKVLFIETDISDRTIGSTIGQKDSKDIIRSIIFYLQKFISAELNYNIHNKELLVIIDLFK